MIRLFLVDDHPAILEAIGGHVAARPGEIEIVGTAGDLESAVEGIERTLPQVVLTDVRLAGAGSGLVLLDRFRERSGRPAFIVLSSYDYPSFTAAAYEGGAAGYLLKTAPVEEIVAAVRVVAGGGTAFAEDALASARRANRPPTERELGLIGLVAGGRSNDEIAAALGLSVKTVESHLRRMFARYGVLSRTELAMLAIREGWIREG
jgi:DNA-binding NarL/FixJ family response regulator